MIKIRTSIVSAILAMMILIGFGTWAFHVLEGWTWGRSFYFSVATLTTVGYGDVHPTTDGTRIFTAFFILIGVGVVIAAITSIGARYLATQEKQLSDNLARRIHRREEHEDQPHPNRRHRL